MSDRYNVTDITPMFDIRCTIQVDMIPMRDGVKLHTNIYFPPDFSGKAPVLLMRQPYTRTTWFNLPDAGALQEGIIYIQQATRGTGWSEGGVFDPAEKQREIEDAEDTLNWLAGKDFFNGCCVMHGASYPGWTQWCAAFNAHPALCAISPRVAPLYGCVGSARKGGGNALSFATHWMLSMHHRRHYGYAGVPSFEELKTDWHLPVIECDTFSGYAPNEPFRKFIASAANPGKLLKDHIADFTKITIPAFISGGWFDGFKEETIESFQLMKHTSATELSRNATHLTIGPWVHGGLLNKDIFGEENDYRELNAVQAEFLWGVARNPQKDPLPGVPQVKYFMLGENRWHESSDWPPPEMKYTEKYLHGDGSIDDSNAGNTACRTYISDPNDPVLVNNGKHDCAGCYDLTETEKRDDLLVYTTGILTEDLLIAGEVKLSFSAAVEAPDTDFFATLTEVEADGRSMLRTGGMIRARFRNSLEEAELLTPGKVYRFNLSLGNVAANFRKGNRLRLIIAGQNFPEYDRNAQSGKEIFSDTELFPAKCTIMHDEAAVLHLPEI